MNNVSLMGRLTADPELKTTPNGLSVVSFSLAVNRAYQAKDEEKKADFINIVAWRQTADFIGKYFDKGQMIALEGSIQTRNYEDKQGNKRIAFEVVASKVHFAGDKSSKPSTQTPQNNNNQYQNQSKSASAQNPPQEKQTSFSLGDFGDFEDIDTDDDLPF